MRLERKSSMLRLSAPTTVYWDITYRCNLRCMHCYLASRRQTRELATKEAIALVGELAELNIFSLVIGGGEPLLQRNLFEILDNIKNKGIPVGLITNATLLSREKAKQLREKGVEWLQVSLDGANARTHDYLRGLTGAFSKTILGIRNAVEANLIVSVATVPSKINLQQIPSIIDLAIDLGAKKYTTIWFQPIGRGAQNRRWLELSPIEHKQMIEILLAKKEKSSGEMKIAPEERYVFLLGGNRHLRERKVFEDVYFSCGVTPQGLVVPFNSLVSLGLVAGDLKRQGFSSLWKESPLFRVMREIQVNDLKDKCGRCEHRRYCGGGLRSVAFAYTQDLFASDPSCWHKVSE